MSKLTTPEPMPPAAPAPAVAPTTPPAPTVKNEDFLYLEEVTGEKALAFARAHNAVSEKALSARSRLPGARRTRLFSIYSSKERIPSPRIAERQPAQLLDRLGAPARALATDHARRLQEAEAHVDDAPRRRRARQGRERELRLPRRELPLSAAQEVPRAPLEGRRRRRDRPRVRRRHEGVRAGGFVLPEAKSRIVWKDENTVYVGDRLRPGHAHEGRLPAHREGVEARHAARRPPTQIFEAKDTDISASCQRDFDHDRKRDFCVRSIDFEHSEIFWRNGDKLVRIDKPDDADVDTWDDELLLRLRSDWITGSPAVDLQEGQPPRRQASTRFMRGRALSSRSSSSRRRTRRSPSWTRHEDAALPRTCSPTCAIR